MCTVTELLHHRIKTSPVSQLRELFMDLLKGHMPKTSFNRKELRCGIQFFFFNSEITAMGTSKISLRNKAITNVFQNPLLRKLLGHFCAPSQTFQLPRHLLFHHYPATFLCLRQRSRYVTHLGLNYSSLFQALRISMNK